MKRLLLLVIFSSFILGSEAQTVCEPDSTLADSSFVLFPLPKSDMNPTGGIPDSACLGVSYELTFQFRIPDTATVGNFRVRLDSVIIPTEGGLVGLPSGMTYACNPADCTFYPDSIISGCISIFGTPDDTVGTYKLELNVTLYTNLGPFPLTLPNDNIEGAEGTYGLTLLDADAQYCMSSSTDDRLASYLEVRNVPNPFDRVTQLRINSIETTEMDFAVYDLLGKQVYQRKVQIYEGDNQLEFDASHLTEGIYIYTISNKDGMLSNKMVVSRR